MDPVTDSQLESLRGKATRLATLAAGVPAGDGVPATPPCPVAFGPSADGSGFVLAAALPGGGEALSLTRDLAAAAPQLLQEIARLRGLQAASGATVAAAG